jgi:gliding motility-associated-like protein
MMNKVVCDLGLSLTKKYLWMLFWMLLPAVSAAQTDTQFWFVAPEVDNAHGDRPIAFRLTSESQSAQVRIYLPANLSAFDTTLTIGANSTVTIPLTHRIADIENTPPNVVHNRGFLIEASAPITAYYEVITGGNNPDIFALKGRNALGTDFFITAQSLMENAFGHERIDIVATEDSTVVQVINRAALFRSGGNIAAGSTTTIVLQRGQTYSLRTNSRNANVSQAGMRISSNKPIAITYIDDSVRGGSFFGGGCFDLLGDQLIPIRLLGQEYIVMRGFLNAVAGEFREIVLVTASANNTSIFLNGGALDTILQAGQTVTYLLRDSSLFIQSTQPVLVAHISGFGCETGLAFLPSIACTGSRQVGFTRTTSEFFGLNLMTKTANVSGFRLNGSPLPGTVSFTPVPGTNGVWQFARLNLPTATVAVGTGNMITNQTGPFHMGIINGGANTGCRYGYFSDFARYEISGSSNSPRSAPLCAGSLLALFADSLLGASYVWTNPAGVPFSTQRNPQIPNFQAADTGLYIVRAIVDGCNSEPDSVYVSLKPLPGNPNARSNAPLCLGDALLLEADSLPGASYYWEGPNGFSSTLRQIVIPQSQWSDSGSYRLRLEIDGCFGTWHPLQVVIHPIPAPVRPSLAVDSLCPGDTAYFSTPAVPGRSYRWEGPAGFTASSAVVALRISGQMQTGWYKLRIAENGCWSAPDSVFLMVVPGPIQVQIAAGTPTRCFGDTALLQVTAVAGYQYQWFRNNQPLPGATSSIYRATLTGSYRLWVRAPQGCADTSAAVFLQFGSPLAATISSSVQPAIFCAGDSILLTAAAAYTYQWFRNGQPLVGATSGSLRTQQPGVYQVLLTDSSGCSTLSDTLEVQQSPQPQAQISPAGLVSSCGSGSLWLVSNHDSLAQFQWLLNGLPLAGATNDSLLAMHEGVYQVVLRYASGCTDTSQSSVVSWLPVPQISLHALTDSMACAGDSLWLEVRGSLGFQLQWLRNGVLLPGFSDSSMRTGRSGHYQAIATSAQGCSDTSNLVSMVFHALPQASVVINGNDSICFNSSTQLTAIGGQNYQWLRNGVVVVGALDSQLLVTSSGTYQAVATNAQGCSDTSVAIAVYVEPKLAPVLQLQGASPLCSNQTAQLQLLAAGSREIQWFRNDTLLAGVSAQTLITSTPGRYLAVVRSILGCSDTSNQINLQFLPLPNVQLQTATGNTRFCAGSSLLIRTSAPNHYTFQWLLNGVTLPAQTADSLVATQAGSYSVMVTDSNFCTAVFGPIELQTWLPPVAAIQLSGPASICEGDSVHLLGPTGTGLRYRWFRNQIALGDTNAFLVVRQAGSYRLWVTNASGCTDSSAMVNVSVFARPVSSLSPSNTQIMCVGDSILLTGPVGSHSYQWLHQGNPLTNATASSFMASMPGLYQLIVTNAQGCSDTSAILEILSRQLPQISISAASPSGCQGDSIALRVVGAVAGSSFEWYYQGSPMGVASDSLVTGQAGNYQLLVTDSFGCRAWSNTLTIQIFPLPPASIRTSGPQSICAGESTSLAVLPVAGGQYQWYRNDTLIAGANALTLNVNAPGRYSCLVSSAGGCERLSQGIEVTVFPRPQLQLNQTPTNWCAGSDLRLSASGPAGAQFVWSGPGNFSSNLREPVRFNLLPAHTGWYKVQVFENGCAGPADSVFIAVEPSIPEIEIKGRTQLCSGNRLLLEPTWVAGARYTWFLPNGDSMVSQSLSKEQISAADAGMYRLRIDKGSCSAEILEIPVAISDHHFYFPTAFTPNNDGLNDTFYPITNYVGSYDLRIYDRWGQVVFIASSPTQFWDGSIAGELAAPGAYSYVLFYQGCGTAKEVVHGSVFLLK